MISFNLNLQVFTSSLIPSAGFGTRLLGDGRVDKTIQSYLEKTGVSPKKIVRMEQVHGSNIYVYKEGGYLKGIDGIISDEKNIAFITITADCVPIAYFDRKNKTIGISHQGWRGLLKGLPKEMIKKMGSNPKDILVAIGPSIGDCCYDISENRYKQFKAKFPEEIFRKENEKIFLNLTKLSFFQLEELGIPHRNIDHFPFCTSCDQDRFFSFRKEKNKEDFPRQFSFIFDRLF